MNDDLLHTLFQVELDEIEADELLTQLASCPEESDFGLDDLDFEPSELEGLSSS